MPRRKCRAYVVTDQEQRTQRVVVRDGDTMEGLLKDLCDRFGGVTIKEITDEDGDVIHRVDDIFEGDTLVIIPTGYTPPAKASAGSGVASGAGGGGAGGGAGVVAGAAAPLAAADLVELQVISTAVATDFVIDFVIGGGQNGMVFAAKCKRPGLPRPSKLYAVKLVFNFGIATKTGTANSFENEYFVLSVLPPHPNVLRFWGTMWDKIPDEAIPHLPLFVREQANYRDHAGKIQRRKAQFIIVDYHPQSLQTHLKDLPNPLSFHYCLEIAVGLLRAVTHLERHRVAHLDLKTDNVLVANDGRIVVCDFGNAVQYATSAMELPFRTGLCPGGNQLHLAPEVLNDYNKAMRSGRGGTISYRTQETFAVAVLLFECAVRTPPWPDYPNDCRGADGIVRYDTDSLPVLPAEYPQEFKDLLKSMLCFDASRRPSAAQALESVVAMQESLSKSAISAPAVLTTPAQDSISVTVKSATGKAMMVTISRSARVADLKAKCVDALLPGQDVSKAILLYAASKCDDTMTLDQVGLEGESCVHLVMPVVMTPVAKPTVTSAAGGAGGAAGASEPTSPSSAAELEPPVFSAASKHPDLSLLNNGTTVRGHTATWGTAIMRQAPVTSGRHTWTFTVDQLLPANRGGMAIGVIDASFDVGGGILGAHPQSWGYSGRTGDKGDGAGFVKYGDRFRNGDTVTVHLDLDAGTLSFSKNGKDQGIAYSSGLAGKAFLAGVCIGGVQKTGGYHQATIVSYVRSGCYGFDSVRKHTAVRLSNGNLTASSNEKAWGTVVVNEAAVRAGRHHWEFLVDELEARNKGGMAIGVVDAQGFKVENGILGASSNSWAYSGRTGDKGDDKAGFVPYGTPFGTGDRVGIDLDLDTNGGVLRFTRNGRDEGVAFKGCFAGRDMLAAVCIGGVHTPSGRHQVSLLPPATRERPRFDAGRKHPAIMLQNGNGTAIGSAKNWGTVLVAGDPVGSGRRAWTLKIDELEASNKGGMAVGVVTESFDVETGILGAHEGSWAYSGRTGDKGDGKLQSYEAYGDSFKTGDEVRIELDMDLGTLQFSLNGYAQGVAFDAGLKETGERLRAAVCIGGVQKPGGRHSVTLLDAT